VLKRACRDILLVGNRRDVRIVYLKGDRDLIAQRLAARDGHFMPSSLLDSQFEALKETGLDECPIVVSIVAHPRTIVDLIVEARASYGPGADKAPPLWGIGLD
jgi:gluconokinase